VTIAYMVAAALLIAACGVAIFANSRIYNPCWIEHPIYVPVENLALCQRQLILSRLDFGLTCAFLIALVVALRIHLLEGRKSRAESPNNRWRGP
jgi:hypothetical protein